MLRCGSLHTAPMQACMLKLVWCAQACLNVLRAGLIASRVDLCGVLFPGVIAAPLVIGTIAGSGGRFSIDAVLAGFGALDGARARTALHLQQNRVPSAMQRLVDPAAKGVPLRMQRLP